MRKLLIVDSGAFGWGWGGQTRRLFDLALGLRDWGWQSWLLAQQADGEQLPTGPEAAFPGRVVRTPFHAQPWPRFCRRPGLQRLAAFLHARYGVWGGPVSGWPERLATWKELRKSVAVPDAIWAVSVGHGCSVASAQWLATQFSCPWVLEFQDPWNLPRGRFRLEARRLMQEALARCASVVAVTKCYAAALERQFPQCKGKTQTVYLSYDNLCEVQTGREEESGQLLLLHAGALHGSPGRNAVGLTRAVARAAELNPSAQGHIRLCLLGRGAGMAEAAVLARRLGAKASVVCMPEVPPSEANRLMAQADVLVVIKFSSPEFDMQIPGKLFQYLAFGKPILGVMGKCEAGEILRRTGLGIIHAHEDVEGMARSLLRLWENRGRLQEAYRPAGDYIRQFARSNMAAKVNAILERALATRPAGSRTGVS